MLLDILEVHFVRAKYFERQNSFHWTAN